MAGDMSMILLPSSLASTSSIYNHQRAQGFKASKVSKGSSIPGFRDSRVRRFKGSRVKGFEGFKGSKRLGGLKLGGSDWRPGGLKAWRFGGLEAWRLGEA